MIARLARAWRWYIANRHGIRPTPFQTALMVELRRNQVLDAQRYAIASERIRSHRRRYLAARTFIVDRYGVTTATP